MKTRRHYLDEFTEQDIEKTLLIFAFFVVFVLVFASVGGGPTFRAERLSAQAREAMLQAQAQKSPEDIQNEMFTKEYMPYFQENQL